MERVLVANLPPMAKEDMRDFERNGGIWGQQRKIRKTQLQCAGLSALGFATAATYYSVVKRRNTKLVGISMFFISGVSGLVIGNFFGQLRYPSVARNDETTMMRRLWWAKKCYGPPN
ncbi:hypothetical protein XU18_1530 [Perkinsela sp. CCAP 1560/4]|nr:hypothetical protein XU18_1530 [Perkinsela sp. CCAP 1560/4]|eukprot:KNH07853.1 hypothetical protein XU18_1530 [Perkinsela sp. CCAP 1560/4]